jgi:predicted nucleic acid-binding protein
VTYLLDTSAVAALFLHEPGGDVVERLLADPAAEVSVCAITWFELRFLLRRIGLTPADCAEALRLCRAAIVRSWPVNEDVVERAVQLRTEGGDRLALADCLIAGCAAVHGAVLVHRDAHFDAIPERLLRQMNIGAPPPSSPPPRVAREKRAAYRP